MASLALYYLILQVLLAVTGTALETYQGMSGMSLSNIAAFLAQIPKAWLLFGAFFGLIIAGVQTRSPRPFDNGQTEA